MPRAQDKSKRKTADQSKSDEAAMISALDAWRKAHEEDPTFAMGKEKFARNHGVPATTFKRRLNGGPSIQDFNRGKQKLDAGMEDAIVEWAVLSDEWGMAPSTADIVNVANNMLRADGVPENELISLDGNWGERFIQRHSEELGKFSSKALPKERASAANPENVKSWFDLVKKVIVDGGIEPGNIYAMDETGTQMGTQARQRVVGKKGKKTHYKTGGGNKETITAVITICGDGTADVKPVLIYKGKNMMKKWTDDNVAEAAIVASENGWTDSTIGHAWMEKVFEPATRAKAAGKTRVLLIDGHSSHNTPEFLRYARDHNIIVLEYPPHCTHILQGLDVACFATFKECLKKEIRDFEATTSCEVTKGDFTGVFGRAYLAAFVPKTVLAAFRATGIVPFNPAVITAEKMAPSLATSTCSSFPVVLPPHVERVAQSFRGYVPSAFELDPGNWAGYQSGNAVAGPSRLALLSSSPTSVSSSPSSASRRRAREPRIDPLLEETPAKRRRILTAAIAASPSTRWLLSSSPITSPHVLPPPVLPKTAPFHRSSDSRVVSPSNMSRRELELLVRSQREDLVHTQRRMVEQERNLSYARGTAFIQHLMGTKQAKQLHTKEKRKKTDRQQILFGDGKARLLTSDDIIQALEDDVQQKKDKEVEKEGRKRTKADLAEKKRGCDEEWKAIQTAHQAAIAAWKVEVENAKKVGKKGRSLPQRPKKTALKRDLEVKWGLKVANEAVDGEVTASHTPDIGLGQGTSDSEDDMSD